MASANQNGSSSSSFQPHGLWSSQKANYSAQTYELLKDMMRESKLTNLQQRQLEKRVSEGQGLPVNFKVQPTREPRPKKQASPKRQPPASFSGMRSLDAIKASGAYDKTTEYMPPKPVRGEKEKDKLARMMANYGVDPTAKKTLKQEEPVTPPPVHERDRFDELVDEINERRHFLAEMTRLGFAKKYRHVETEISQLVREMEQIDAVRSRELDEALKQQQDD